MGAFGSVLGIGSSNNGASFQAQQATLSNPYSAQGVNQSIEGAQGGIGQQQAFVNALQAQNGLANQSSVYNQLQGVANGTGPNPAQAQLAQATGQNVQNQAALMAGQRGASQNAGLIARQAAQQGANTQQQAVGQAATMQANQSLNALNSLGSLANQQVANQQQGLSTYNNLLQGQQAALMGGLQNQNQNILGNVQQANSANSGIANTNAQAQGKILGGFLQGAGTALMASGGEVGQDGQSMSNVPDVASQGSSAVNPNGPKSTAGKFFAGMNNSAQDPLSEGGKSVGTAAGSGISSGISSISDLFSSAPDLSEVPVMAAAQGGEVPALLSPGERYLNPHEAKLAKDGKIDASKAGKKVPGEARVKGNSLKNDIVPATLQTGGLVIPKSVMESKNPSKSASKFVSAVIAKSKHGKK